MPLAQGTKYPFGLRDVKIYALTLPSTYATGVDLPASRTLSFAPEITSESLEGDDQVVAVHSFEGSGTWELEAGGIGLDALALLNGGTTSDSGNTPNVVSYMDVLTTSTRPYFGIIGRAISDSGDAHIQVFKAKCTSGPEGEFSQGAFYLSSASGIAIGDANSRLYRTLLHETAVAIPSTWPATPYTSS